MTDAAAGGGKKSKSSSHVQHVPPAYPPPAAPTPARTILTHTEREIAYRKAVGMDVVDLDAVHALAFQGVPDAADLRPLYWKLLLGYLPADRAQWARDADGALAGGSRGGSVCRETAGGGRGVAARALAWLGAAAGSAAERAALVIEPIEARFRCLDCGHEGAAESKKACCPECRSTAIKMTAGREFFVESLKVE